MTDLSRNSRRYFLTLLVLVCLPVAVLAQTGKGSLKGQVTDPSGAAIPAATITLVGPGHSTKVAHTDEQGRYTFSNLEPGTYTLEINSTGFSTFSRAGVQIANRRSQTVNAQLVLSIEKQQVTVQSESQRLSVSPENNVGALVLKGAALKSLSNDPTELQSELQELAGPAAGPNGGQIYIDGFSGGQLPPKSAILEVRVNQDPFSAQYERLGYGRIDITTKPGFQKYHGQIFGFGNDSAFNSRNPFVTDQPGYYSDFLSGNFGGPIGKKASFFLDVFHMNTNGTSIVNNRILNPNYTIGGIDAPDISFSEAVPSPSSRMNISPRVDLQLSQNNVLSVHYQRWSNTNTNAGIGQLSLPSQAYDSAGVEHVVQLNDTQVVSTRTVTQTAFQYRHNTSNQTPFSLDPTINVIGNFTGGGSSAGSYLDTTNQYELHSLTSMTFGKHNLTYGGRIRYIDETANTTSGYNGTYTFPTMESYAITEQGLAMGWTPAEVLAAGGGASQFSITSGNPIANINRFDYALFGEDTWRMRPNVSLTLGLRLEGQNDISDHFDVAPRMGFAWGIGGGSKGPKTVLRAGAGIFYDRFDTSDILQAEQLNGINQQQYLVNSPDFLPPYIPPVNTLTGSATYPTIYQIAPNYQSPYVIEAAVGLEREITRNIKTSVTYITTHGVHQLLTRNINAPLPGTYNPADPTSGIRPFGDVGNIYQYENAGLYNENQLIANFNINMGANLSLFGYYTLSYANTNANSFPMDQYNLALDYGPAAWAIRNRFFVGGSVGLPYGLSLSPFLVATSGQPYNVTVAEDLYGSSLFNSRPALSTTLCATCVSTPLGIFNYEPAYGQTVVPINDLVGPGQFSMNLRLAKTFGFGGEGQGGGGFGGHYHGHGGGLGGRGLSSGGGGFFHHGSAEGQRYQIEVGVMAHNVFNKVNLGTPIGNVQSSLFGQSISLAGGFFGNQSANRSLNLFLRFSF